VQAKASRATWHRQGLRCTQLCDSERGNDVHHALYRGYELATRAVNVDSQNEKGIEAPMASEYGNGFRSWSAMTATAKLRRSARSMSAPNWLFGDANDGRILTTGTARMTGGNLVTLWLSVKADNRQVDGQLSSCRFSGAEPTSRRSSIGSAIGIRPSRRNGQATAPMAGQECTCAATSRAGLCGKCSSRSPISRTPPPPPPISANVAKDLYASSKDMLSGACCPQRVVPSAPGKLV